MLTLKLINEETERVVRGLEKKHFPNAKEAIDTVLSVDKQRREAQQELDKCLNEQKQLSGQIGRLMKEGKKDEAEQVKAQVATLKEKSTRKAAGTIWQHDLSATVKDAIDAVQTAIVGLETNHIYIVFKREDGSYYLLYALPESSQLSHDVTDNTEHTLTVNYTCKSNYPAVVLTSPNFS